MQQLKMRRSQILLFLCFVLTTRAQLSKKNSISNQEILSVLGEQPNPPPANPVSVPLPQPELVRAGKQPKVTPKLNVEPLPSQTISGSEVLSNLQSACQALKMFISRAEQMQQYLAIMPPDLMPWLYAMKMGFPTECGFSSYSNALNVFVTACSVFESCPLPSPMMDIGTIIPNVTMGFEMPAQPLGGLSLPSVQMSIPASPFPEQPMPVQPLPVPPLPTQPLPLQPLQEQPVPMGTLVPIQTVASQPVPIKPQANVLPKPTLPEIRPSRRKVQVQAQQIRIPQRPSVSKGQQNLPRVQVITKVAPRPLAKVPQPSPKAAVIPQPQQPALQEQIFQRMPVPSMASMYPVWFYGFRPVPMVGNVGRSFQQNTTPSPTLSDD